MSESNTRVRWSKRRRRLTAVVAVVTALSVAAAVAIVLMRAQFQGGGSIQAPSNIIFTSVSEVSETGPIDCQVTLPGPGSVANLQVNGQPGSDCLLRLGLRSVGTDVGARLQDVRFSSVTTETFEPSGACGATVPSTGTTVDVRISIPSGATTGDFTAQADAGVIAVDGPSWSSSGCPTAA